MNDSEHQADLEQFYVLLYSQDRAEVGLVVVRWPSEQIQSSSKDCWPAVEHDVQAVP